MRSLLTLTTGLCLLLPRPLAAQITGSTAPPAEVEGKTLAAWRHDLTSPDASTREQAIRAILLFGIPTSDLVTILLDRCRDKDTSPRVRAVMAFQVMSLRKDDYERIAVRMGEMLRSDPEVVVRYQAAVVLLRFGEYARPAVATLAFRTTDPQAFEVRHVCVMALSVAGRTANGPDPRASEALITASKDPTARVRLEAVMALGTMGRPMDSTLQGKIDRALRARLMDTDKSVAIWAHASQMLFEGKATDAGVKPVIKGLTDPDMHVRLQSAKAVGVLTYMDPKPTAAIPALIDMIRSKDHPEALAAIWALGQFGDPGAKAREALKDFVDGKDGEESVKEAARAALEKMKGIKPKK
jgi:HEAT repeat protein